jgi:hypothetical protein
MSAVLVDANVLLDVMTENTDWTGWSAEALARAADRYRLVINPIIYAEVSIRYSHVEELEAALPKTLFDREEIPYEATFWQASRSWLTDDVAERSARRFPISLSARTQPSANIFC